MTNLSRNFIEHHTIDFLRKAGGTRPDLRVVDTPDGKIVVKDFKNSDTLFKLIVGPILIRREYGALRKLIDVQGIPQLVGKIDRYAVAIEHIPATSLDNHIDEALTDQFYDSLRMVVDKMHERGVAHCDLRSRGNVMLGDDGKPYVVDFAACVYLGRGINPLTRALYKQFVLADNNAVLRIKKRLSPHLLTKDQLDALDTPLPFERPAKAFGVFIRNLTRRFLTRK